MIYMEIQNNLNKAIEIRLDYTKGGYRETIYAADLEDALMEMAEWKEKQFEETVNGSPQSMNEAEHKHWNKSPILWDYSDFKHKEEFIRKVEELINIYGIDAALNTPDYLLAEYILNCLILFGNTLITKRDNL